MLEPIPFAGMVEIDMDTNDLADRLEQFYSGTHIQKAAEVLRQQQAEIEALKAKTLTDEEIVSIYESSYLESGLDEWEFDPVYFARSILRKAQEK
jgi:hypothetical protein